MTIEDSEMENAGGSGSQGGSRETTPVLRPLQPTSQVPATTPQQPHEPRPEPPPSPRYRDPNQHQYQQQQYQQQQYQQHYQQYSHPQHYPPATSSSAPYPHGYQHSAYPPGPAPPPSGSYSLYQGVPYPQYPSYPSGMPPPLPPPPGPSANWMHSQQWHPPDTQQTPGSSRRSSATTTASNSASQAPTTTAQGKRRRVDGAGKAPDTGPASIHLLQSQYDGIERQLNQLSQLFQSSQTVNRASATDDQDTIRLLLDSVKETNDILRAGVLDANRKRKREPEDSGASGDDELDGHDADTEGGDQLGEEDRVKMEVDPDDQRPKRVKLRPPKKRRPAHRSKAANAIASAVRGIFKDMFKGHVANPEAIHEPGEPAPTPSIDNFVLDLNKPPGSCWNRNSRAMFVDHVIQSKHPDVVTLKPSASEIQRLFVSNFRRQRSKMKWANMTQQEKDGRETEFRRKERKRGLYYRRLQAADRYNETKRHLPLVAAYGIAGMSTDESDHNNPTGRTIYNIIDKQWRHPAAAGCLHLLDALHRDSKFRAIRKAPPGAQPRNRLHPSNPHSSSTAPVRGLPSALYNSAWLDHLPPLLKQDLCAEPSGPYDFSHEPSIVDRGANNHGHLDVLFGYT